MERCFSIKTKITLLSTIFLKFSVTSWQSVLLVEETAIPGENHRPDASH
jgi:hypothetical protein